MLCVARCNFGCRLIAKVAAVQGSGQVPITSHANIVTIVVRKPLEFLGVFLDWGRSARCHSMQMAEATSASFRTFIHATLLGSTASHIMA